jgi:hypothetical protein
MGRGCWFVITTFADWSLHCSILAFDERAGGNNYNQFVRELFSSPRWLKKLNYHIYSKILFFDSHTDLAAIKPYVILSIPEATRLTDKFEALGRSVSANPEIGSTFDHVNSNLDAGIAWCRALYLALENGYFPNVVLPLKEYQAAMLALHLGDQINMSH